ncbi:trefoil factor 3 isoform X1 [Pteropus vampyrus]|uniref:Trefoil factor 3 n=1 Tax=Pteropus vampyrus TaxID=132908 RepID=A0A6P6D2K3_PTEVA|nr:trefoil factor 3 isoform X1 [Pteropus vampyrus]
MEARALWLLVAVLAVGSSSSSAQYLGLSENQCAVPAKDRVDCGYPEVTQEQCNSRGCCFDSSIPQVPWCFKPLQETGEPASRQSPSGPAPGPRSPGRHTCLGPRRVAQRRSCPSAEASGRGFMPGRSAAGSCPLLSC